MLKTSLIKTFVKVASALMFSVSISAFAESNTYLAGSSFEVMPLDQLTAQANSGNTDAQFFLANRYKKGLGVSKNEAQAFAWYLKAAKKGAAPAQLNVGQMYATGKGVKQDLTQARIWLQKAAKQGDNRASYNLAILDERKKNLTDAYKWYELSVRDEMLSDTVKQRARGKIITLAMKLDESDIATARNRADDFLQDK